MTLISETHNQVLELPVQLPGRKNERKLVRVITAESIYVVCYFSLIIFSTVQLASFATRFARRELCSVLTLLLLNTTCPVLANSVDPDQLALKKPTDLDLHCLPFSM